MFQPRDVNVNHGSLTDKVQFETVLKYVEIGKESSGKLVLNENRAKANGALEDLTVHPVIFTDLPEDSKIMKRRFSVRLLLQIPSRPKRKSLRKPTIPSLGFMLHCKRRI